MKGWLLIGALAMWGCGYSVVGSRTIFGAHTIVVMPFVETQPLGLAPTLLQELSTLMATGGVALSTQRNQADAVLTGEIKNLSTAPEVAPSAAANGGSAVISYRLNAVIEAKLFVRGRQVWSTSLPVNDSFLPAPASNNAQVVLAQSLTTEAYRREALVRIAQSAAFQLHEQMAVAGGI